MHTQFQIFSKIVVCACAGLAALTVPGCGRGRPNNPYPNDGPSAQIYYTSFSAQPKHLDPARAYSSDEYGFMAQIYEPPFQYHYLKRPYELIPLTAESLPEPQYRDVEGNVLPKDAVPADIHRVTYEIRIRKGILYQNHPCFAKDQSGNFLYHDLTDSDLAHVYTLADFPEKGTRELSARDYVFQICRMADPRLSCPIFSVLEEYFLGYAAYRELLKSELARIRGQRKAKATGSYDQERDERAHPILLNYLKLPAEAYENAKRDKLERERSKRKRSLGNGYDLNQNENEYPIDLTEFDPPKDPTYPFPGIELVDEQTFKVHMSSSYPQILFWMAMPFFSPMPPEAEAFYQQGAMVRKNITIDQNPIGTGAYRFSRYDPKMELVLVENENFRDEFYPDTGEAGDRERGLLRDAGRKLPIIPKFIYKLEKESLPRWNKFLQGYYDASSISSDSFDKAIDVSADGADLSEFMKSMGVQLSTATRQATYYMAFNMLDPIVGGYTPDKQKLRQAIAITVNQEERIEIFSNGRGIPAHSPVPPGIFGSIDGPDGLDPFVYDWDSESNEPVRKPLSYAKQLLAEAGYPGGRSKKTGQPLELSFDNTATSAGQIALVRWYQKKFARIGISLESKTTDYSRFRDKVGHANFQIITWGWLADYPDPENFLFLLYGPNGKKKNGGENAANYDNTTFNVLFEQMKNMENSPERLAIIRRMIAILQKDAPWAWGYHPVSFSLRHAWVRNNKPNEMANNVLKYYDVDPTLRSERRAEWNSPVYWPLLVLAAVFVLGTLPAIVTVRKRERGEV